jgi:polygalacturonase
MAEKIRTKTTKPSFPDRTFNLLDFTTNSNKSDYTDAFRAAIQACHGAGGGVVEVPKGNYPTGPIHLLSRVNLHLLAGAEIQFLPDTYRYLPPVMTRWEGLELMGYSPLIYAFEQENIAVTGQGVLNGGGNASTWWPWKGEHDERDWALIPGEDQKPARKQLMRDAEQGVPVAQRVYTDGAYLRPPLFQPYRCNKVWLDGVTLKDSPFWLFNPVLCNHVTVTNTQFSSMGPNSDGCNPESCDHVVIENCLFDTGDDCIAIKSGRNADGRRLATPSQNIVIANCTMHAGHGGVVVGSEISGGVRNVFVENCLMDSPDLKRAIRIKTNSVRGGVIEHLRYRKITVGKVKNAIVINFYYEDGDTGDFDPTVRDIVISNLSVGEVLERPFNLQGFPRKPIEAFTLVDCAMVTANHSASVVRHIDNYSLTNVRVGSTRIDESNFITEPLA